MPMLLAVSGQPDIKPLIDCFQKVHNMSLFSWLGGSPNNPKSAQHDGRRRNEPTATVRSGAQEPGRSEDTKSHRHARREELYVAIRESMTRAGVLSSRFKFKVLSLDQQGNTFLVMMDLTTDASAPAESLTDMEQQIMRHAMARFDIAVSSVYWRLAGSDDHKEPDFQETMEAQQRTNGSPAAAPVYRTIEVDELAAFKEARLAAARRSPPIPMPVPAAAKSRRPSGKQPDFADTQLTESPNATGLSATQYGDLN